MPFNSNDIEWNKSDIKPAQTKVDNGWTATEKPPASIFNWFFYRTAAAIKDLLANAIHKDQKGVNNGVASLDANGDVPVAQLPIADSANAGVVVLTSATNDTSTAKAATAAGVKAAYDAASAKYTKPGGGIPKTDLDATTQAGIIPYGATAGTGTAYTVTLSPAPAAYTDGMPVSVKINVDSTGAASINVNALGARTIKKANGNDIAAGSLKNGSIYTMRYNATTSNFILQGEGGAGDATAGDILFNKTASTDAGDVVGTMPNRGSLNATSGTSTQNYAAGYYSGVQVQGDANLVTGNIKAGKSVLGVPGKTEVVDTTTAAPPAAGDMLTGKTAFANGNTVNGSMVNNGVLTITPGTADQAIPQGYHPGTGKVKGDANLAPGVIKKGYSVFGVSGTYDAKQYAEGTVSNASSGPDTLTQVVGNNSTVPNFQPASWVTVSGLTFLPSLIEITYSSAGNVYKTVYDKNALAFNTPFATILMSSTGTGVSPTSYNYYFLDSQGATYVTSSGFKLPFTPNVGISNISWRAFE